MIPKRIKYKGQEYKLIESKSNRIKESRHNFEEWSDKELAEYIYDNFKRITGVNVNNIFTDSESEDDPIFDQAVVDKTSDKVYAWLSNKANKSEEEIDDFMYYLDDYLTSRRYR